MDDARPRSPAPPGRPARLLVALLVVGLPLLGLLPNLSGWFLEGPPGGRYLGFRHLIEDHWQYASFAAQARDGEDPVMRSLLTTDPHPGRFVAGFPWLVGRLARLLSSDVAEAWLVAQYLAGAAALAAAWFAMGQVLRSPSERLAGFLLATLASGLDGPAWLLHLAGVPGLGLIAEPYGVYWNWNLTGSLALPLWSAAQALLLTFVGVLVAHARAPRWTTGLALFVLPVATWCVHPYSGVAGAAIGLALPLVEPIARLARGARPRAAVTRGLLRTAAPALAGALAVACAVAWTLGDPVVAHATGEALASRHQYPPGWWPVTYGGTLLLAWFGARDLRGDESVAGPVVAAWTGAVVVLSLMPFASGYKFQYLVAVPMAVLAARGVSALRKSVPAFASALRRPALVALALGFAAVGTLHAPFSDFATLRDEPAAWASDGELAVLDRLAQSADGGAVACRSDRAGLVAWRGRSPVPHGHYFLTPRAAERRAVAARAFAADASPQERWAALSELGARWIVTGPRDARVARALLEGGEGSATAELRFEQDGWMLLRIAERR